MPPPVVAVRKFVFKHELPPDYVLDDIMDEDHSNKKYSPADEETVSAERTVPVVEITAQVLSFGARSFWVHLSETRVSSDAPPPVFGPCAVAIAGISADVTSTAIIDDVPLPLQSQQQQQQESGYGAPNPQTVFAQSLAQRLARRLQKMCGTAVTVYVACGLTGEKMELLGTPAGCSFDVTMRFGAAVFQHVLELIREELLPADGTALSP
ncbi:uncharacterized protein TM35_000391870 [Trypanosoma theileri]|uniref:Proteasome assembly chaperone 3 n=1 Tax=Trypanosoma theileri TaxID=67003 RepID=A0A1X0NKM1_9TRYP|nr:uncharacterized protein TM35_000391870 [Trypanosoma theileri]ORC85013.1 hypothetical protein TM35_000391870 [Trypanosoma theileri]